MNAAKGAVPGAYRGLKSRKWQNSAARRRAHAKFRSKLCAILGCPLDSCYTTGELLRDAKAAR